MQALPGGSDFAGTMATETRLRGGLGKWEVISGLCANWSTGGGIPEGGRGREGARLSGVQPLCNSHLHVLHYIIRSASQLRDLFIQSMLYNNLGSFIFSSDSFFKKVSSA